MALKQKWEKLSIFELLSIRDGSVLVGLRPFISLARSDPKPKAWSSAAWNAWVVGRVKGDEAEKLVSSDVFRPENQQQVR